MDHILVSDKPNIPLAIIEAKDNPRRADGRGDRRVDVRMRAREQRYHDGMRAVFEPLVSLAGSAARASARVSVLPLRSRS